MKSLTLGLAYVPTCALSAAPRIDRLEPMNWWVGMKNPAVQRLVYGDQIADLHPRIDYPGVEMRQVIRVANPRFGIAGRAGVPTVAPYARN